MPYLTRRDALRYLGISCASAVLTGCGSQEPGADGRDSAGRFVLTYWNGFTGPDGVTMERIVGLFLKANPDLAVSMQLIPWDTYYDKLTLSLAYGGAPDVFIIQAARFPEFASFKVLRPLQDLYRSDSRPLSAADFFPIPWRESFYGGIHFALPLDTHPMGLYYNTRIFEQAGVVDAAGKAKPPTDLNEFLRAAAKMTRPSGRIGVPQWGFVITNQHTCWLTFADQFGGGIVTPDGKAGAMSSAPSLAATQLLCDLIYKYRVAPRPEGVDPWLAFREGKVAMVLEGIYMLESLEEEKSLQFAGAPVPQFGTKRATWGGSHLLCQPAGARPERARAAWRLMRFISDHSLIWGQGGQVPARAAIERLPAFQALPVQSQFARELSYVVYDPQIPRANSLNQFADPAIEAALLQLQPPEEAMRDADRRIDELLSRP